MHVCRLYYIYIIYAKIWVIWFQICVLILGPGICQIHRTAHAN
jgi:hypothetical protein